MVASTSPIFVEAPKVGAVTFVNADGTTLKTLLTAGVDGSKVFSIAAVSDDTAAVNMKIFIRQGSIDYWVGTVRIPTLSGTDGATDAVDLLNKTELPWLDSDGEFALPPNNSGADGIVKVAPLVAVTAAKTVTLVALYGDY